MTDIINVEQTATTQTVTESVTPASSSISLKTAINILKTIQQNRFESVAFWGAKTAYSGVYRTAVQNGWIEDGVFVTDIPDGVDGGFLDADMQRIAIMAELLEDVLRDKLPEEEITPTDIIHATVDARIGEVMSNMDFSEILGWIDCAKDEILEQVGNALDEVLSELG